MKQLIRPLLLTTIPATALLLGLAPSTMAATITEDETVPGTYTLMVPSGVKRVSVTLTGAGGGMDAGNNGCVPGRGGELKATISVTPGALLTMTVGSAGGNANGTQGGAGGAPYGGDGGSAGNADGFGGGGGGGYTEIRDDSGVLARVGGGGGCGGSADGSYGDGGNADTGGQNGSLATGGGAGDTGGAPGVSAPTSLGSGFSGGGRQLGGRGAFGPQLGGGGGGGGWAGGGGGGGTDIGYGIAGGGGGGSAFVGDQVISVDQSGLSPVAGDGAIEISWTNPGTAVGALFGSGWAALSNKTILQTQSPAPWSYTVPADGVITSWAYESGPDAPTAVELKVGRGVGGPSGGYTIIGQSGSSGTLGSGQISTFPARIAVRAGDVLGAYIYGTSDVGLVPFGTGALGTSGDQQPGFGAATYSPFPVTIGWDIQSGPGSGAGTTDGAVLPIEAFVEPDADHDGFGDISQDQCPGVPGSVHGCPSYDLGVGIASPAGSYQVGDTLHYVITVSNAGPDVSPQATLTDDPGAGAEVVSASAGEGSCTTATVVTCTLSPIAAGGATTVTVIVRATQARNVINQATAVAAPVPAGIGAGDTDASDDSVTSTVAVLPAPSASTATTTTPGTASIPAQAPVGTPAQDAVSPAVSFGGVALRLRGPIVVTGTHAMLNLTSELSASGALTITSRAGGRGRGPRFARATFTVRGGHVTALAVRLSSRALRLLRSNHRLPILVVLRSHDPAGVSATVTQSAVLAAAPHRLSAAVA